MLDALSMLDQGIANRIERGFTEDAYRIEQRLAELERSAGSNGATGADGWRELSETRDSALELFAECLALAEGAWARQEELENGLCKLADALVDELSDRVGLPWNRLTIPAEREFYADLAQVIRVRFPDLGVWDLPLAAHEFGHYAAERLDIVERRGYVRPRRNLVREFIDDEARSGEQAWAFAHEYFADAFATYTVGPAYVYSCVFLRLEPVEAHEDEWEHPAPAKRVQLMLDVLAKMDDQHVGLAPFRPRSAAIASAWSSTLADAGEDTELSEEARENVAHRSGDLYERLRQSRPTAAYDGFHRAQALAAPLDPAQPLPTHFGSEVSLVDVLNAAWLSRVDHWGDGEATTQRVEERALAVCEQLAGGER